MTAPTRKVAPREEWPQADRDHWDAAFDDRGPFDGTPAAKWRPATRRAAAQGWGRWIAWLAAQEPSSLLLPPRDRLTEDRVTAYARALAESTSRGNAGELVRRLRMAARALTEEDLEWMSGLATRLMRRQARRDKRPHIRDARELLRLGEQMIARGEKTDGAEGLLLWRDGMMIAFLAGMPLRRGNFASLRLGHTLLRAGDGFVICISEQETKNHRPLELPLPRPVARLLRRYLAECRPRFPGADCHDGAWPSLRGRPLCNEMAYARVVLRTKAKFGVSTCPHLFRDSVATTLVSERPEGAAIASAMLGHASPASIEHYIGPGADIAASRTQGELIARLRHGMLRERNERQIPSSDPKEA